MSRTVLVVVSLVAALLVAFTVVALVQRDDSSSTVLGLGDFVQTETWSKQVPDGMVGWRMRYPTSDHEGSSRDATGSVLAAEDWDGGPRPVLAWAHGTTGVAEGCAPASPAEVFGAAAPAITRMVEQGWVVVATDYAGLGTVGPHGFLVGPSAAHDVLDSVRAVHEYSDLDLDPRVLIWGGSQGGHAALWAAQAAEEYAPELDVIGAAAIAPPADVRTIMTAPSTDLSMRSLRAQLVGSWHATYPDNDFWDELPSDQQVAIEGTIRVCSGDPASYPHVGALPDDFISDQVLRAGFGDLLEANIPTGPFPAPVLVAQGTDDELVAEPIQTAWADERCAEDQLLDYRVYEGRDHYTIFTSNPMNDDLLEWADARLAGEPATPSCD